MNHLTLTPFGTGSKTGKAAASPSPYLSPHPHRKMESQQEAAAAPQDPQRSPEEQEDQVGPKTFPSPMSLATGTFPVGG